jgi:hypothetical protein
MHTNLPQADTLTPFYLYLMGQDSAGVTGQTFEMQPPEE